MLNVTKEEETMCQKCNKHEENDKCPFKVQHDLLLKEAKEIVEVLHKKNKYQTYNVWDLKNKFPTGLNHVIDGRLEVKYKLNYCDFFQEKKLCPHCGEELKDI